MPLMAVSGAKQSCITAFLSLAMMVIYETASDRNLDECQLLDEWPHGTSIPQPRAHEQGGTGIIFTAGSAARCCTHGA